MEETGRHLDYLDGWRGCAIAAVIAGHFFLEELTPSAAMFGVQLFFVLTGRLMAEILFVRQAGLQRFYVRRISRVVPALYCFIIIMAVAFSTAPGGYPVGVKAMAAAATFTINYAMIYSHAVLLFDHLWSLCVEEHSYILLSIVALACRRNIRAGGLILGAVALAAFLNALVRHEVFDQPQVLVVWRSDVAVAQIAASASLCLILRQRKFPPYLAPILLATGAALSLFGNSMILNFVASTMCLAGAIATLDQAAGPFLTMLSAKPVARLGQYSFSLYLWQQPFYKLHRYDAAPLWILFCSAILSGLISYYVIERPARRAINDWFDRRPWGRRSTPTAGSAVAESA